NAGASVSDEMINPVIVGSPKSDCSPNSSSPNSENSSSANSSNSENSSSPSSSKSENSSSSKSPNSSNSSKSASPPSWAYPTLTKDRTSASAHSPPSRIRLFARNLCIDILTQRPLLSTRLARTTWTMVKI